jgi:hypothetical protein
MGFVNLAKRNASQNLERRGCGHGKGAVSAFDRSVAIVQRRRKDFRNAERLETNACHDDIGDGIEGAHFMKVNVIGGLAVNLPFRNGDAAENSEGVLLYEWRKFAAFKHCSNVSVGSVFMFVTMFVATALLVRMLEFIPVVVIAALTTFVFVLVVMMMVVVIILAVLVLVLVMPMLLLMVMVVMIVRMGMRFFVLVLLRAMNGTFVNCKPHALDLLPLGAIEMHVKLADGQLG